MVLLTQQLRLMAATPTITEVSFSFTNDNISQEIDETFSITFTGLNPSDTEPGSIIIGRLDGVITDIDGEVLQQK